MAWALTEEAFAKLLKTLDPDRDRAGEKYEELRRTLVRFFEWRGAAAPEEQADEALNRTARRLLEGQSVGNLRGYCYGVAKMVLLESIKKKERAPVPLEEADPAALEAAGEDEDALETEHRLRRLEECLRQLPPENRELIMEYYQDERRDKINRRKALADRLGIPRLALGNRAQRLRDKLADCVKSGLRKKSAT